MDYLYDTVVVLHFVGLAALLGGFLTQVSTRPHVVNRAMVDGAMTQLVTGLALVGLAETVLADEEDLNHAKIGIKLVILLVITALAWANRRKESISTGVWAAIGLLTLANIVIAVFV